MKKLTFSICISGLLFVTASQALINPNFTLKDVFTQCDLVVVGNVSRNQADKSWTLTPKTVLKGTAPKEYVIVLDNGDARNREELNAAAENLMRQTTEPVILLAGTLKRDANQDPVKLAFLHAAGAWHSLESTGKDARWTLVAIDGKMNSTVHGGTDAVILMADYIAKDADASVPVKADVKWKDDRSYVLGKLAGKTAGMAGIEIGKKAGIFAGMDTGDHLFMPKQAGTDIVFTDVTAAVELKTKSLLFAWMDVDRDGQADLVTWDGTTLSVVLVDASGKFKPAADSWTTPLSNVTALAPCSFDGTPGLLVSTTARPLLLKSDGTGWKQEPLPAGRPDITPAGICVVADLNQDGAWDVLMPGDSQGLLWKGKQGGGFDAPVVTPVCAGGRSGQPVVGDFNADGYLDIFVASSARHSLWENDGKGNFKDVFGLTGSMTYKCPLNPSEIKMMDLNQDGRQDLNFIYKDQNIMYHFNRGYRCFGEESEVSFPDMEDATSQGSAGLIATAVADLDVNGSQDLVVMDPTGLIRCYLNDKAGMPGVNLRLPKGQSGCVTVSGTQGENFKFHIGTTVVTGHTPPAYLALRDIGVVVFEWVAPDGSSKTKRVIVENKTVNVVLD